MLAAGDPSHNQDGPHATLYAGNNVRVHAITNHHCVFGVNIQKVQCRTHHQWQPALKDFEPKGDGGGD